MPRNGSGVYSPPGANYPAVSGTLITAANRNAVDADVATALTGSIAVNGESVVTANIPFAGNKLTGIGAATARTDAASIATIQDGAGVYVATVGGTADVITLTPSPAIASYVTGQLFSFIAGGANTTNVTVNVSGLGAKAITKNGTTALVAADIPSGFLVTVRYDGTRFQLVGSVAANVTAPFSDTTAIVKGSGDATKLVRIEADGLTTGTTRVLTAQDADGTIAYVNSQTFTGTPTLPTGTIASTQSVGDNSTKIATTAFVQANKITSGTAIATTSGTSHDFTGIPSTVKRITINFSGVSVSNTSSLLFQLGDAGGIESSGYVGYSGYLGGAFTALSSGFIVFINLAGATIQGTLVLTLLDSTTNTWCATASASWNSSSIMPITSGSKALSATLDRVRLTTVTGTDTFDAGSINILYE